jgi:hypothetical protein
MRNRITNLGKVLVEELGSDPSVDTLARWMAHYIAEQMIAAENATADDRIEAEQHCFETILKLWQHRSSLPHGQRPFESFEPILSALARLDPENPAPYFYSIPKSGLSERDDLGEASDEVHKWLDIAQAIDRAARVWLEYVFHQAALSAADEKTITWLKSAVGLPADGDISTIIRLLQEEPEDESGGTAERERQAEHERLKSRIKKLDVFVDLSQDLRAALVAELETVAQSDSSVVVDT